MADTYIDQIMPEFAEDRKWLEDLFAGGDIAEMERCLKRFAVIDRQAILCTACHLRDEVKANCTQRGNQVDAILTANCRFYVSGQRLCFGSRDGITSTALTNKTIA